MEVGEHVSEVRGEGGVRQVKRGSWFVEVLFGVFILVVVGTVWVREQAEAMTISLTPTAMRPTETQTLGLTQTPYPTETPTLTVTPNPTPFPTSTAILTVTPTSDPCPEFGMMGRECLDWLTFNLAAWVAWYESGGVLVGGSPLLALQSVYSTMERRMTDPAWGGPNTLLAVLQRGCPLTQEAADAGKQCQWTTYYKAQGKVSSGEAAPYVAQEALNSYLLGVGGRAAGICVGYDSVDGWVRLGKDGFPLDGSCVIKSESGNGQLLHFYNQHAP